MKEKENEFLELDFYDLIPSFPLERRDFLKLMGGGITILCCIKNTEGYQQAQRRRVRPGLPDDFNAFLRVGEDGRVTCFTGKIEQGQGAITALAQMLADELDVTLDSVDMVMGDTDLCPWDMGTFGSMSIRFFGPPLRAAAAEARLVLMALAGEHFKTFPRDLTASEGEIFVTSNPEKRVSYLQLTKGKKITRRLEEKAVLKNSSQYKVMGKSFSRGDAKEKVTGKAKFAGDIHLDGMLYARILRPPAHGATLKNADTSKAKKINGLKVVEDGDFIAVLHTDPEQAYKGLAAINAEFEKPEATVDDKTIFDHLLKVAPEGDIASSEGNLATGEKQSASSVEETYLNSYVAHSTMETHTAVVNIEGNKATVWPSTQTPFSAKDTAARALDFPPENVRVITPFVGGGFGGKSNNPQTAEAARLAKMTGKPVQVAWTRAEEFYYDSFRPAAIVKIKAGIKDSGQITLWDYGVYFAGQRGAQHFYDIPHHATTVYGSGWRGGSGTHPFATGAWRAPANNTNTFARESHIDMLAVKAGMDPVKFRMLNLKDKKMRGVLKAAAEKFGWTAAQAAKGRGYGVALGIDAGTYVALIAEVEVDKSSGHVQVKRVVCAQNMGLCINPLGTKMQIEGCITMGLGYALTEEIRFKGGEVLDTNFDTYELPRFSWLPKIESVIIDARNDPAQGGGEPAIICMGGLIANAIYNATGARLFQLPMTPERVKAAIQNV